MCFQKGNSLAITAKRLSEATLRRSPLVRLQSADTDPGLSGFKATSPHMLGLHRPPLLILRSSGDKKSSLNRSRFIHFKIAELEI